MKKIYLLSTGEDEDHKVLGAFSSPAKWNAAKKLLSVMDPPANEMETFVIDEATDAAEKGFKNYTVALDFDGNCQSVDEEDDFFLQYSAFPFQLTVKIWFYENPRENTVFLSYAWADDSEHAVKIVTERRRQYLAAEQWRAELARYNPEHQQKILDLFSGMQK